ncbi:MAG: Gfo/Idh/MocA family oxidoreductase [Faecalibacterium sp.]
MKTVRLGIIGVGNMGTGHSERILAGNIPNMELTAVCDINPDRIVAFKEKFSAEVATFDDAETMMDSGLCDAILVSVPHYDHPKYSMMAMKKGLHVMCEKPAGVYTKQVVEMNECAKACDVTFAMMFNQRTNCVYRKMKEIVDSGELGEIKRVNWIITSWYRPQFYYDSGAWRATWEGEGGGVLLNQCPHNLDLVQWICGMPSKVTAFCHEGKWHDIEVEDDVTAYLEYPNGATGTFITTTGETPGTNRFEISFDGGKLVCEKDTLTLHKLDMFESEYSRTTEIAFGHPHATVTEIETDGLNEQHDGVLRAFTNHILEGTPLIAGGEEGLQGLTLSNSMHLSSWLGQAVTLPLDEDLFLAELDKRRANSRVKKDVVAKVSDTSGSYNN